jgi:hypothetical protein
MKRISVVTVKVPPQGTPLTSYLKFPLIRNLTAGNGCRYSSSNSGGNTGSGGAIMPRPDPGKIQATYPKSIVNPWKPVKDKKTGLMYYWNPETKETTAVGARKPEHWVELPDPSGKTSLTYWWNPETQETTALGVLKPTSNRVITLKSGGNILTDPRPPMTFGRQLVQGAAIGFAFTCSFLVIRVLFG